MMPMILLLGGTSDTPPIALRLAESGYRVLVSQATDVPLETGCHPNIESRSGPLDEHGLANWSIVGGSGRSSMRPIRMRWRFARRPAGWPKRKAFPASVLSARRPSTPPRPAWSLPPIMRRPRWPRFGRGRPVLLTTGTRNLAPYVEQSRRTGLPLVVRVLDRPDIVGGLPAGRHSAGTHPCRPRTVFAWKTIAGTSALSALACW